MIKRPGLSLFILLATLCCCFSTYAVAEAATTRSIRVVMDDNYPPFVFKDGSGKLQGILIDQWRLWEQKTGIRAELSAMDWGEALHRMKAGEFDVIDTIFRTDERTGWLDFTKPYATLEVPIFFTKEIAGITNAASLKGFIVAAKSGDAAVDMLKGQGVESLVLFNSYEAIIRAAREHKITVFVIDQPPALYFLHKFGIQDQYKQSAPLYSGAFHRAVKKGNGELLKRVEEGFGRISPAELKQIEVTWYGSSVTAGIPLRYLLVAAGCLILLILGLFVWNRSLRKAVNSRTAELMESKESFQAIYNSVNDAIFIHDIETGAILDVNQRMCEMFGCTREEACTMPVEAFSSGRSPYSQAEAVAWLAKAAQGEPQLFEWLCKDRQGRLFWGEVNMRRARIGTVDRILVTTRDIRERRNAEEALRESESRLRSILEASPVAMALNDLEGNVTFLNRAFVETFGYTMADIPHVSRWWPLAYPDPDLREQVKAEWARMVDGVTSNGAGLIPLEAPVTCRGGEVRLISFRLTMLQDVHLIIMDDITYRKKEEEKRLHLERQLFHSQKLESLGVLAGGVAHDFNNLLMAIIGNLDLAQIRLQGDSSAARNIDQALFAARRAADLTNRMLAYSGKGAFALERIDLSAVVEENAMMLRAAIAKTATLSMHLESNLPQVIADMAQIQQVVMNLITNASDSLEEQAGVITLATGVRDCDDEYLQRSCLDEKPAAGRFVWLEVADTGCGMAPETIHRLFDPFFTTKFTGRGLGMSAVLGIVRGHRGALLVDSIAGAGTTIRMLLPAVGDISADAAEPFETVDADMAASRAELSGVVLVVDDEDFVRDVCRAMIEQLGFRVLTAVDGGDAVRVFQEHRVEIAVVLLDMTMPQLDGLATFRELRKCRPDVRVILCSGFSEQEIAERFAGEGLAGFIQKPYSMERLHEVITRVLGGSG